MTEVLANMVTASFGFKDINDNSTEIGREQLINAIPKLQVLQPLLVEAYKSNIKDCYEKGLNSHADSAKLQGVAAKSKCRWSKFQWSMVKGLKINLKLAFGSQPTPTHTIHKHTHTHTHTHRERERGREGERVGHSSKSNEKRSN